MKNLNKLIVLLMLLSLNINVFGQVLPGYKQVNSIGGENDTNTAGGKDGVKVSKTIAETNLENYFDITLKVTTTSKVDEILRDPDLAVVIVMDVSNTMIQYNMDGSKNKFGNNNGDGTYNPDYRYGQANDNTRYATAMTAGKNFINEFASYSSKVTSDTKRQIGYVAFNSNAKQIFDLTDCKSTSSATNLINKMTSETRKIMEQNRYNASYERFTNIEAGLKMAKDMLNGVTADNKYIIFLSDGLPTTYISSGYTGYNNYNKNDASPSKEGVFYNNILKAPCHYGVDYSNLAAIRAREMATSIKASNISIYTVGVGIESQTTVQEMINKEKNNPGNYINNEGKFSLVDIDTTLDKSEVGQTKAEFKNWLKSSIGSNYYYSAENKNSLENAYTEIFKKIKNYVETSSSATWVAEDPMSATGSVSNIEFVGLYDDKNALHDALDYTKTNQSDTATFTNNKISWDLKKSNYETKKDGNTTYYTYELKYRIRLENEKSNFAINTVYDTNGRTTLTYVVRNNGLLSSNKYIDFPIPSVEGYLGDLTFTKLSNYYNTPLSGAKFELTHDTDCPCQDERKHATISTFTASSDSNGTVSFKNVPSGHIYKLKETVAPTNYELSNIEHTVNVSYGKVTLDGKKENLTIDNNIKTSNLKVKKTVKGDIESSGEFNFEIELKNGNSPITGSFKYTIGTTNGTLIFNENGKSEFKLKHNEEIIIYDLPYDVTYKITEKNTDGYQVKYCLNASTECLKSQSITEGKKVSANISKDNNVEFVNITNYVLPETGSSMGLIMMIIASISLIVPIIYIAYSIMDERKEERI